MRKFPFMVILVLAVRLACAQETALPLQMRGGAEPPSGSQLAVDQDGLSFMRAGKAQRLSWDRVLEVRGDLGEAAKEFAPVAARAWRARTRLERLDYVGAEPLFESLFEEYAGRQGPTPALVAEGVLRCRLRRGVQTGAVGPWLAWLGAVGDDAMSPMMEVVLPPGSPPLVDDATGLCPGVPPIWLRLPVVEAFARGDLGVKGEEKGARDQGDQGSGASGAGASGAKPETTKAPGGEQAIGKDDARSTKGATKNSTKPSAFKVAELERLYVLAAAFEVGTSGEVTASQVPLRHLDPGIAVVAQIVGARAGTPEVRREARRLLTERLSQRQPQWLEAWVRVGIGRSLMREDSVEERLLGVAQMLHVPARLRGACAYLAGVALATSAIHESGTNPSGAWNLKKELMDTLQGHPALDLEQVRSLKPPATAGGRAGGRARAMGASTKSGTGTRTETGGAPQGQAPEEAK